MSRQTVRRKGRMTTDGYENVSARLGLGQDNMLAKSGYASGRNITGSIDELENMYRESWVVGRMVEVVAEDMVRGGITIQAQMLPGQIDTLTRALQETGVPGRMADAIKWARLYGGALAVILIDGQTLSEPLELESIPKGGFRGLYILDRHQVTPTEEKIKDFGPMLGYPAGYRVTTDALQGDLIHHTRVIRFVGIQLPMRERLKEQGWGASVVERAFDRILALDSSTYGAANLMFKSFLRVLSVDNLRQLLSSTDGAKKITNMFDMIRRLQSNEGITLIDAKDTFGTHSWTFAGIYEALQAFCEQISGATGIPLVRLLGQSPKGFSTGDSDLKMYYETILTAQEDDLRSPYKLILEILSWSLWGRALDDDVSFSFNPLATLSESEKSQIASADAQSVAGLLMGGILDRPQALSVLRETSRITGRFGGITDEAIAIAKAEERAPSPPEEING